MEALQSGQTEVCDGAGGLATCTFPFPSCGVPRCAEMRCQQTTMRNVRLTLQQTQEAMEEWNISNVKSALERGVLRSVVPEQSGL